MRYQGHMLILICVCSLWKVKSANREVEKLTPSSESPKLCSDDAISLISQEQKNITLKYMMQLYKRDQSLNSDIVKAILPTCISEMNSGGKMLKFTIPPSDRFKEYLEGAELLGERGAIKTIRLVHDQSRKNKINRNQLIEKSQKDKVYAIQLTKKSREDNLWQAFNVTSAVNRNSNIVELHVYGPRVENSILLLNYRTSSSARFRRSTQEDRKATLPRKKRKPKKNMCRRIPMKVNFEKISFEPWVIAPLSYEAYQCTGSCVYPIANHLTPTPHAVIRTMMHSSSQNNSLASKGHNNVCCVPTKMDSISMIYKTNTSLIYRYGVDNMVVVECGCR